jgi:SAM-dependent methyltransferase
LKDNFSSQAAAYSQFRPGYPDSLVQFLLSHTRHFGSAWDCATGNGQLAVKLAPHFQTVFATDISDAQLRNAPARPEIIYKKERAESSSFADGQFDLVTVAQAVHWFRFDAFYEEVYRTLKDDGLFAVAGYSLPGISPETDAVIRHFYTDITGPYWDPERRYIDEAYTTIPFPFDEIPAPQMSATYRMTLTQLTGYLETWSAVQHYIREKGSTPLDLIRHDLSEAWGGQATREASFPLLLRAGRKRT